MRKLAYKAEKMKTESEIQNFNEEVDVILDGTTDFLKKIAE